ncbi:hypothetical protein BDY21DRAFT_25769 [Lineolata rhizophorae]|uniref:Uncharacterized protein n=1 Tax=Lineolata rhizophorae TaxID=578093 RepID=A0A6A6P0U0_9PEZI|nr:hypothetical protein BDY21DRAFT_25769 [Lineolata rhizophorae]
MSTSHSRKDLPPPSTTSYTWDRPPRRYYSPPRTNPPRYYSPPRARRPSHTTSLETTLELFVHTCFLFKAHARVIIRALPITLACIFCPPLAVYQLENQGCSLSFFLNVVLTACFVVPGIVHALTLYIVMGGFEASVGNNWAHLLTPAQLLEMELFFDERLLELEQEGGKGDKGRKESDHSSRGPSGRDENGGGGDGDSGYGDDPDNPGEGPRRGIARPDGTNRNGVSLPSLVFSSTPFYSVLTLPCAQLHL